MTVRLPLSVVVMALAAASVGAATKAPAWNPDAWKANFNADGTPKPLKDPKDTRIWPNRKSFANSDPWIAANHDRIRQMRPRILLINLCNYAPEGKPMDLARQLIANLRESSRYKGFRDPKAPPFLEYTVWRYIDLRDPGVQTGNTSKSPIKPDVKEGMNTDYGGFFSQKFAGYIGVRDPKDKSRFLRLDELVDQGFVHEVVVVAAAAGDIRMLECIEEKPQYDENFKQVPGKWVQAGNGGDDDQPWTGRSLRINSLNIDRGIGCGMENLGHSLEGTAHSGAIPYFTKYFHEYGMFDLDKRYGLPFNSYYHLWGEGKGIEYPDQNTAVPFEGDRRWEIKNYVAAGGNVHFCPNARGHYDLANTAPVMSTIEDWRIGSGPDGKDIAKPWTNAVLEQYKDLAPDCQGRWLVYWRQNMPGLDNKSKDDDGKPMKNWWPFLFY